MLDTSHKYFRTVEDEAAAVFFHPFTANPFPQWWAKDGIFGVIARLLQRLKLMFFKKILISEGPFGTAPFEIIF